MEERDINLLRLRPEILGASVSDQTGADEQFQNQTLRPVVKLQNELFVEAFKNYLQKYKSGFYEMSPEKKLLFIDNSIQKDMKFRNSLKGMVIGQFSIEEYKTYIRNSSALNKRMMNLVKESIKNNVQLLDPLPMD